MGLLFIVLILLALAAAVLLLRAAWRADDARAIVNTTYWLALIFSVVITITGTIAVVTTLVAKIVTVDIAVATFWPTLPEGVTLEGMDASIRSGGFTTATLDLAGLSMSARILLATSIALQVVTVVAISSAVVAMCRQARTGRPFARTGARVATVAAVIVAAAGLAAQTIGDIGANMAARQALDWEGAGQDCTESCPDITTWWPEPAITFELSLWPIGAALVLVALGMIWRHGAALERETEGLV